MSGQDIDLCDSVVLVSFIFHETEYYCDIRGNNCCGCPNLYNSEDDIYLCRKEHLAKRLDELSAL